MKKSLLALAVLGAYAGVASAQSSVTLYGTVYLNGRYVKQDVTSGESKRWSLGRDGINGQFMMAASEAGQAGQTSNNGRYLGGRVGFAAGPFDVAFAYGQQRTAG